MTDGDATHGRDRDARQDDADDADDARDLTRRTVGAPDAGACKAGATAGAIAGATAGPPGALAGSAIGGLAGFLAGSKLRDAPDLTPAADEHYRRLHERTVDAAMPYDHVRDLYRLGHVVAGSEEYGGRDWRDVEPELRDAWTAVQRETWGEWPEAAPYVRGGYEHPVR